VRTLTAPRHRNQDQNSTAAIHVELVGDDCAIAVALGVKAVGYAPVLELCRALVAAGVDPRRPLEAWRGHVLCLRVADIGKAARWKINSKGTGLERLSGVRTTPPVEKSRSAYVRHRGHRGGAV
jgi:hypothetical protein